MGAQRLVDVMHERDVVDVVERAGAQEIGFPQQPLHLLLAAFGQRDGALLFILLVILGDERRDQLVGLDIKLGVVFGRAGDDERRPRLVDQDRIHLVDDRVMERPMAHLLEPELHIIAEIVEAELVIGAVGHVAQIRLLALGIIELMDDASDRHAEEPVDLSHPLGIALGEVIVDRDDVDAFPGQRVEIDRQRRDEGLAFAGLHLGDHAAMQHDAAHHLHVEMALPERALGGLAHGRECFRNQIVEFRPVFEPLLELRGLGAQRLVRELLQFRLVIVDLLDQRPEALDVTIVGGAEQPPG